MIDKLDGVQVVHLRPEDKVIAIFDTNILTPENACELHEVLCKFFHNRPVIGLFGTELKFVREEDNNAEDNFEKYNSSF